MWLVWVGFKANAIVALVVKLGVRLKGYGEHNHRIIHLAPAFGLLTNVYKLYLVSVMTMYSIYR